MPLVVNMKSSRSRVFILASFVLLGLFLISACQAGDGLSRTEAVRPTENPPTPFQSIDQTPTASVVYVWLSPGLPDRVRVQVQEVIEQGTEGFQLTSEPSAAQVRIESGGEMQIATWVYALVAPFASVEDGMSYETLQAFWSGEAPEGRQLFVSEETHEVMTDILGMPASSWVQTSAADELLDLTWDENPAYAIVPFEDLEPRWKVLTLDGQSPIRKGFDRTLYPLSTIFGMSGDPAALAQLWTVLDAPSSNYDPSKLTTLAMTGVTALTRATAWRMETRGISFPGELIGDWLQDADLAHVSNEVPFVSTCPYPDPVQEKLKFCSDPAYIQLLVELGIDLVELTGNHVWDYGSEELVFTLDLYRQYGMDYFGGGENLEDSVRVVRVEHNGNRLAFLGCNWIGPKYAWAAEEKPGAAPCDWTYFGEELRSLSDEGYLPIFTFQWAELAVPSPAQEEAFRDAAEAGAVIISGSQAHEPQGFEFLPGGFIHYGLGNLFFDQMQTIENRQEFIDLYVFYDGRHISTELLTAMLEYHAQPRPMTPAERSAFLERIFTASGW